MIALNPPASFYIQMLIVFGDLRNHLTKSDISICFGAIFSENQMDICSIHSHLSFLLSLLMQISGSNVTQRSFRNTDYCHFNAASLVLSIERAVIKYHILHPMAVSYCMYSFLTMYALFKIIRFIFYVCGLSGMWGKMKVAGRRIEDNGWVGWSTMLKRAQLNKDEVEESPGVWNIRYRERQRDIVSQKHSLNSIISPENTKYIQHVEHGYHSMVRMYFMQHNIETWNTLQSGLAWFATSRPLSTQADQPKLILHVWGRQRRWGICEVRRIIITYQSNRQHN